MTCESTCRVAGVGLCGTRAKVVLGFPNAVVALSMGKMRKGYVLCVKCAVWSVKCEVCSVRCAVSSVQCQMWSAK